MNRTSSTLGRMLNILAVPGEVFDEVVAAPANLSNWRTPMLLACLASLVAYGARPHDPWQAGEPLAGALLILSATMIGSLWTGLIVWFIGRMFLRVRFSLAKALEVAGLAGTAAALGQVVTLLLEIAFGSRARPTLAAVAPGLPLDSALHQALDLFNCFHLWTAALICLGLSRLARVSLKETSFWVLGYWIVLRLALIVAV
jgi:hypothetical protein